MNAIDGEPQKMMTIRAKDPFGFLLFELRMLVPASMVKGIMTDWTNTLTLKAIGEHEVPYYLDVVVK